MEYLLHIVVLSEIFAILALSLDLVFGHAGVLCIAQGALWGVGAYTSTVLMTHGVPFIPAVVAAAAMTALVSGAIALMSLRLRSDYLAIGTLGVQMILLNIFNNWTAITRGPMGIAGIPQPRILWWEVTNKLEFAALGAMAVVLTYLIVSRIVVSPLGRVLHGVRENEMFTESLGKNSGRFKLIAFSVSGGLASLAGSIYACYISYIDPTSFTVHESILILSMVIVGGAGTLVGPVIGAALLVTMPELLRFVGAPISIAANLRQMLYGTILVGMILCRPHGLAGRYDFGRM